MELPKLNNGILYIGDSVFVIRECNLDTLIENFGYPVKFERLESDQRVVVFQFQHEMGALTAFLFFEDEEQPVIFATEAYVPDLDRGQLVEIQLELDEFVAVDQLGKQRKYMNNGSFEFVLFRGKTLGRIFREPFIDALCFFNKRFSAKAEQTFFYRLCFWHGSKKLIAQRYREELKKSKKEKTFEIEVSSN